MRSRAERIHRWHEEIVLEFVLLMLAGRGKLRGGAPQEALSGIRLREGLAQQR
jgi:hypothetical protein